MGYLVGEGRANEHVEPHLVAGSGDLMAWFGTDVLDRAAAAEIGRALDRDRLHFGTEVTRARTIVDPDTGAGMKVAMPAHVWHCSLAVKAGEGELSDEVWGRIADDFVTGMGFAATAVQPAGCTWVAVRHGLSKNGNDHIHVAVNLVRSDGTVADTWRDYARAQTLAGRLEQRYGLAVLEGRQLQLGGRALTSGESARAAREGAEEPQRRRLERAVRAASAASVDEGEFVRRLRQAGVLARPRFETGRDDVVAGYSVAIRPAAKGARPVWFGGGRLARDLTLPRLREGWPDAPDTAAAAVAEWRATSRNPFGYKPAAPGRETRAVGVEVAGEYVAALRQLRADLLAAGGAGRDQWAHVARDAAGVFSAWSWRLEPAPGPLAAVATDLRRSAEIRAGGSAPRPASWRPVSDVAALMLAGGAEHRSTAELVLWRELGQMTSLLLRAHAAAGGAQEARDRLERIRQQMSLIGSRLDPADAAGARVQARAAGLPDGLAGQAASAARTAAPLSSPLPPTRGTAVEQPVPEQQEQGRRMHR